ncbi:glycosyl transferase family 2 [Solidesulfovibrio carbinoliphilus subsp. oakridgensis]|uniref:Glycosyl transferase family 2 n=1 Tax=Solidesulfovibrio carbinoliphilus subsp. oakridgensis TaxID=694327 RepID=G7Q8N5_9BACT|nr:glycosyltransferase family 2 protein [Solidesulfovibrio carbinoliphilus]EHJ49122.1 glycosyl transferase family 2 [Solidesulfovibrio carbinoliphilus subsp. oakridgensis]
MHDRPCCDEECGVVILNWNGHAETLACLAAVLAGTCLPADIVICDNGSTDGSVGIFNAYIAAHVVDSPVRVTVLDNGGNRGYAAGINPGIRKLLEAGRRYVWILNNDTIPDRRSLEALLACSRGCPEAAVVGSTIVRYDDGRVETAGGFRYDKWTTKITPLHAEARIEDIPGLSPLPMDYIYGCSMFIAADIFRTIGLFNEKFFLFYEELDFCTRAKKHGIRLSWCTESMVIHMGGRSRKRLEQTAHGISNYHENLSNLIYTRDAYPFLLPFVFAKRLVGRVVRLAVAGRWDLVRSVVQAYGDFLSGRNQSGRGR